MSTSASDLLSAIRGVPAASDLLSAIRGVPAASGLLSAIRGVPEAGKVLFGQEFFNSFTFPAGVWKNVDAVTLTRNALLL